ITFVDENGDPLSEQGTDPDYDIDDPTVVPPAVPEKPGYSGEWPTTGMTDVPGDHNVKPVYTAIGYTITFVTDGDPIAELAYTIESTDVLPVATGKANFAFVTWKVTATDTEDSWASNSTINAGTPVTGRYGNVTLTAQWEVAITYEVNSYKYADDGEMLLIVDAANVGDGKVYTYAGATMYYTEDASYMISTGSGTTTAVYFTLIPATENTLTDAQIANIEAVDGTPETITYDGDINGDGKITIADANVIYQMLAQDSKGAYYTGQLNVEQRLAADLDKTDAADFHGSIKDVEAAVAIVLTQTAKAEALDEMFANYVCVAEDLRKMRSIEA
ncbi:MAG: hypothetical protein II135_10830, partial [Clostridia bacterium]|nr:hypothetical protein [Clostridia bacterium]